MNVIVKEFEWNGDIEAVFIQLYKNAPYAFWLDGNRMIEGLSGYSFMGATPRFRVTLENGVLSIHHSHSVQTVQGDPFTILQHVLDQYSVPSSQLSHLPFIGGFVGYFGFEMLKYVESIPVHTNDPHEVPEGYWAYYDQVVVIDQIQNKAFLTCLYDEGECKKEVENQLSLQVERIQQAAQSNIDEIKIENIHVGELSVKQTETYSSYIDKIGKIKEYLAQGDIYQACFTHRFSTTIQSDPFQIYQVLRRINPAPFSCYVKMGELSILSSSPERFLKRNLNGTVESRPIKGTRPRGKNEEEDNAFISDLQQNEKDRAENVMIVDLVRNDLGRVCKSVSVPQLLQVESYATVHQLVSVVHGELDSAYASMEVIRATFPGGSMTGAPKVRALQILHDLERVARGVYSGGLGYLDVRGSFDLSMVIRTILCSRNLATFHVGGGIVADSEPDDEYQESLDKAVALKRAIWISETM